LSIRKKINSYFANFQQDILFQYEHFESEAEMMYTLFDTWFKKIPLLTGWNFIGFDWTYLVNRAKRI
jgi:DNA polymerase elongation subunit (family B)